VVVAVPTAPASTCQSLREEADEVICATTPRPFRAVGYSYRSFPQTSDEEVTALLRSAWAGSPGPGGAGGPGPGGTPT
jgi:predicted phosphoribosyltransferase